MIPHPSHTPWDNHNGWLGVKHQITYLLTPHTSIFVSRYLAGFRLAFSWLTIIRKKISLYLFTIKKKKKSLKEAFGQIQTRCISFKNTSSAIFRKKTRHFYLSILWHQRVRNSFSVKYKTLRQIYLPAKFYNRPSAFKVAILLADKRLSFPLAIYISKAFELRVSSISNTVQAWSGIMSHLLLYCSLFLSHIFVLAIAIAFVCFKCVRAREYVCVPACANEFELAWVRA